MRMRRRVNADRLGSLAQLLRKAAFFVVGSCFYKQGALNGEIFLPADKAIFRSDPDGLQGKATQDASKKAVQAACNACENNFQRRMSDENRYRDRTGSHHEAHH